MGRKARVPGMRLERSFRIPECSVHGTQMQKNDVGEWFCIECFDSFLNRQLGEKSRGGVVLPSRVEAPRPSIKDIMPNRRWRRHAR